MEEHHLKSLLNDTSKVVEEQLEGLVALNPKELALLEGHNVVVRRAFIAGDHKDRHVALLSGGGSGHEPAHAGFVGEGLLTAAIAGNVFTSPSTASVLAALRTVTGKKGALLIVKNYTGDKLNFGMAAELARAEGLKVNMVVVADDCALSADLTKSAGRRGLAGTVLVHKAAGAAAEAGASLDEVTDIAQRVAQQVRTIGIALTPCIIPAVGKPSFTLPGNEVELGLGIHGEPGVERQSLQSADETVKQLMGHLLGDANLPEDTHVVLLVNNLGTTTSMELHIVCRAVVRFINKHTTVHLERLFCGPFMTALDMKGISISLLPLPREERLLEYLDAPCGRGTAWLPAARCSPLFAERVAAPTSTCDISGAEPERDKKLSFTAAEAQHFRKLLQLLCEQLCQKETIDQLTALDQAAGDGDFGFSLEQGCKAISSQLVQLPVDKGPAATFHALGSILQSAMGGTSGVMYGMFFVRAAGGFRYAENYVASPSESWAEALRSGTQGIMQLGGARLGDCTMIDALLPAVDAFHHAVMKEGKSWQEALGIASDEAAKGAEATVDLVPKKGRASYLGQRAVGHKDAGAAAVALIVKTLNELTK